MRTSSLYGQKLTAREAQILAEFRRDAPADKEIAWRTGLSAHTVKVYMVSIRRKLGASNRSHLLLVTKETGRKTEGKER